MRGRCRPPALLSSLMGLSLFDAPTQDPLENARQALREQRPEAALAAFEARLAQVPGDVDARVGAGFAALRLGRLEGAAAHFQDALARAPRYVDALFGLALCRERSGQRAEAQALIRQARALDALRADVAEAARRLDPAPLPPLERPATLQVPFRVDLQGFQRPDGRGGWTPFFLKGINLGAALPGRFPSEFPDKATYEGWIRDMAELGVNAVRVYTIHPPAFYEALRAHNLRAKTPLYLIHGVWTEPPIGDDYDDPAWFEGWREEMGRVVDLLHGRADLPERPGHASGVYRADLSPWWIATILGREWEPDSLWTYLQKRPGLADWAGRFLEVRQGHAMERFLGRAMDAFLALEMDRYHTQRPLAYTNWPTLDPLSHITESTFREETALRRELGVPGVTEGVDLHWDEDAAGLDMEKVFPTEAARAGFFASYHAYPYFPDFLNLDPEYGKARDEAGPNRYLGYLRDLVRHHARTPVFVAEVGVPSSRIEAHVQPDGFHHGGQSEREQGEQDARLIRTVHQAGCAGGLLFALVDEWFKRNWLTQRLEVPVERKPLWYNPLDAEQNYGLIGHRPGDPGPAILIDGRPADWAAVPTYLEGEGLRLKLLADEGWLYVGLAWNGRMDLPKEALLVGFQTVARPRAKHVLPGDVPLRSEAGLQFALRVGSEGATLLVDQAYDPYRHSYAGPLHDVGPDGGPWAQPRTQPNPDRVGRDRKVYRGHERDIGRLRQGTQDRSDPAFDSRAEWALGPTPEGGFLEVRLPWGLLGVTDPSRRRVVNSLGGVEEKLGTTLSPGFRVLVVRLLERDGRSPEVRATLPARRGTVIPEPPLFAWPSWETPRWHAFRKQGFPILKTALSALPDRPVPRPTP